MYLAAVFRADGLIEARWEFRKVESHDDLGFHHPNAQPVSLPASACLCMESSLSNTPDDLKEEVP